jgi:hypothetical protein
MVFYLLFNTVLPFPKRYESNIIFPCIALTGLLFFGMAAILLGHSKLDKFLGFIYILFWGIAFLKLLDVFSVMPP